MKVFLFTAAFVVLLAMLAVWQAENDFYQRQSQVLKHVAEDAADAAALYYAESLYATGLKVYRKDQGNLAIEHIIRSNWEAEKGAFFPETNSYKTYYFDQDGMLTIYADGIFQEQRHIGYPFSFSDSTTGYEAIISEATVVVTINAGTADFSLSFINDPDMIRSSAYEHRGY